MPSFLLSFPSLPFYFYFRGLTRDASSLDERKRDERKRGKHPVNNLSGLAPFVPYLRACAIAMTSSCQPRHRVSCLQPQKAWATTPTLYKDRPVSTGLEELSFSFLFGKSRQDWWWLLFNLLLTCRFSSSDDEFVYIKGQSWNAGGTTSSPGQ